MPVFTPHYGWCPWAPVRAEDGPKEELGSEHRRLGSSLRFYHSQARAYVSLVLLFGFPISKVGENSCPPTFLRLY